MVLQQWSDEDAQESMTLNAVPELKETLTGALDEIKAFIDKTPTSDYGQIIDDLAGTFDLIQLELSKSRCHVAQSDIEQLAVRFRDLADDVESGIKFDDLLDVFEHTSHDLERIIEED